MIEIRQDDLFTALADRSGAAHYLDRKTGEILFSSTQENTAMQKELNQKMEQDPGRWLPIAPVSGRDALHVMESFVNSLPDGDQKKALAQTLTMEDTVTHFQQALYRMPNLGETWRVFHNSALHDLADTWLAQEGIVASLI